MSDSMNIAVLGAGNIGTLIAAKLAINGATELFIHGRGEHAANLAINGITIVGIENFTVKPNQYHISLADVETNQAFDGLADVIFICSKASDVENLLTLAKQLSHKSTNILVLSNGLGHLESAIDEFGSHRVIPATTTHGAWRKNPGIIHWAGNGAVNIGRSYNSPTREQLSDLFDVLEQSGLNPKWIDDGAKLIWSKVLLNIAINPIASITGRVNGDLLEPEMFETCVEVMLEGARVARLEGVALDDDEELISNLRLVLEQTKDNRCSMLQDIRNGRSTEIDFLNRMVVNKAEKYGLSTPLNQLLSKLIEDLTLY